ncbi:hypothetical protein P2O68_24170, partial [Escherichia coli]
LTLPWGSLRQCISAIGYRWLHLRALPFGFRSNLVRISVWLNLPALEGCIYLLKSFSYLTV